MSLTVREVLPTKLQLFGPIWFQTSTVTAPALSPGYAPLLVPGNGTVSVVLVPELARAAARINPLRMKLTTDKPKPEFTKLLPVIVKLADGVAKSITLGVMEFTPGGGRVSLTVSEVLPTKVQLFAPVWFQTSTVTAPALSPGYAPALVPGNGTVSAVLVPELARAAARMKPLRVKLTTDSPNPESAKPNPAKEKVSGGAARSMGLGVMEFTSG